MFCENCGSEIKEGNLFCEKCGASITGENINNDETKIKGKMKKIFSNFRTKIIACSIASFILGGAVIGCIIQYTDLFINIMPPEEFYNQTLAAGNYEVGKELKPGIYYFTYNLRNKDSWGGDYIYVTNMGSDGANETLGGTKYDFRVEGKKDGDQISVKLNNGDKIYVETDSGGVWNPAK